MTSFVVLLPFHSLLDCLLNPHLTFNFHVSVFRQLWLLCLCVVNSPNSIMMGFPYTVSGRGRGRQGNIRRKQRVLTKKKDICNPLIKGAQIWGSGDFGSSAVVQCCDFSLNNSNRMVFNRKPGGKRGDGECSKTWQERIFQMVLYLVFIEFQETKIPNEKLGITEFWRLSDFNMIRGLAEPALKADGPNTIKECRFIVLRFYYKPLKVLHQFNALNKTPSFATPPPPQPQQPNCKYHHYRNTNFNHKETNNMHYK